MVMNLTLGLMILAKLHKHGCVADCLYFNMSFYLMLSSDGCRDIFPTNQGGDFKVQLDRTLDMRSHDWEVALVEMIYTGQSFPNISTEDAQITLKASGKPEYENQYIITYEQTFSLWISMTMSKGGEKIKHSRIHLPRQHYSWTTFKDALRKACIDNFKLKIVDVSEKEMYFADSNPGNQNTFTMTLSADFMDLFGLSPIATPKYDRQMEYSKFIFPVTKTPKAVEDSSMVFYSPFAAAKDCKIIVNDEVIFKLTEQYWSIEMFKRAITAIGKNFTKESWLSSLTIEKVASDEEFILIFKANPAKKGQLPTLFFSDSFKTVFGTAQSIYQLDFEKAPLRVPITISEAVEQDLPWPDMHLSKNLSNNFYTSVFALVTDINSVLAGLKQDLDKKRKASGIPHTFFGVKNDGVAFFEKQDYTVTLSSYLAKLMNLSSTTLHGSTTSSKPVVMKESKRSHFYIHLDCLDYHYINNNVSDLIKIIPNKAEKEEKLQVTFHDPHYYTVAGRYLSTINMYITDSYFDGILDFEQDVTYTLHFRKSLYPF
jgi:hypothetical protein